MTRPSYPAEQGGHELDANAASNHEVGPPTKRTLVVETALNGVVVAWHNQDPYHEAPNPRYNMGATATMTTADRPDTREQVLRASNGEVNDGFEQIVNDIAFDGIVDANNMRDLEANVMSYSEDPLVQPFIQPQEPIDPSQAIGI